MSHIRLKFSDPVDDRAFAAPDWSKEADGRSTTWWTPERVAELKRLWKRPSMSMTLIAEQMGTTKGAIAGKRDRLGLANRTSAHVQPLVRVKTKPKERT